jgi:hypothetical protein
MPAKGPSRHPGENDSCAPHLRKDLVEAVQPPNGQQVRHAAAADPNDVLVEQKSEHVVDTRHGKQIQVHEVNAGGVCGVAQLSVPGALVA